MTICRDCVDIIKEVYPDITDEQAMYMLEEYNMGYPWFLEYPNWKQYLRHILLAKESTYQRTFNKSVLKCVVDDMEDEEE